MSYRVIALPTATAEAVRKTNASPGYGHPAHTEVATGHGPCRHCLRTFRIGAERRILFTYDPFAGVEELPLPGPIFIHEEVCERFPEERGVPEGLEGRTLTLNGYARGRRLQVQEYAPGHDLEAVITRLLTNPEIEYIHVRDTEAGCFDFAVERAPRW